MFGSWWREISNTWCRDHRERLAAVLMGYLDNLCSTPFPWESEASHCILRDKELILRDRERRGVRMGADPSIRRYWPPRFDLSLGVNPQAEDRVGPDLRELDVFARTQSPWGNR